ncbi:MAG TPA: FAD-binding protein, partial [Solirubrobacteraceae bacterium]
METVNAVEAIRELATSLGEDAVVTDPEELALYRDPYDYRGSDRYSASAVVNPRSVEDVQAIVRIASRHRVPLWTIGQGRNNAYGGAAPI